MKRNDPISISILMLVLVHSKHPVSISYNSNKWHSSFSVYLCIPIISPKSLKIKIPIPCIFSLGEPVRARQLALRLAYPKAAGLRPVLPTGH